jgi:hypothetical protein
MIITARGGERVPTNMLAQGAMPAAARDTDPKPIISNYFAEEESKST